MVLTALDSAELQAMSQAAGVRYVRKAFDDVELQTVAFLASLLAISAVALNYALAPQQRHHLCNIVRNGTNASGV